MKKRKVKKAPFLILLVLICLIFGALHFFKGYFNKTAPKEKPEIIEKKAKEYNVSFTLAGNVLVNSNMWNDTKKANEYNFEPIFEYVNDIMKKSDINLYSQQSILGGKSLGMSAYYNYNTPEELLTTMKNIGFNAASVASKHSYDKGLDGIKNSIKLLKDNKFLYSGVNDSENRNTDNIIKKNNVNIGLLSYVLETDEKVNEEYAVNIYSDEKAKQDVEDLKKKVDIIIVTIDWSNIISNDITEEQTRIATYLSDLGVNILVGNTGYSIQPIEMVNNTLVCYSLGNLLSGHISISSRISAMLDFNIKIVKDEKDTKITFNDLNVLLNYAYNLNGYKYKVIPFTKITNELKDYKTYYDNYKELFTSHNNNIKLYTIGE